MNKEKAAAMLPIFTAFAEGKQIQYRSSAGRTWRDATSLSFICEPSNYRIKPAPPRSIFRIEDQNGRPHNGSDNKEHCDSIVEEWNRNTKDGRTYRTVEYVEKVDAS